VQGLLRRADSDTRDHKGYPADIRLP
jgi:hypothetical protein